MLFLFIKITWKKIITKQSIFISLDDHLFIILMVVLIYII